ncbi:hypothetical protein D3C84_916390 [compost metagenome]
MNAALCDRGLQIRPRSGEHAGSRLRHQTNIDSTIGAAPGLVVIAGDGLAGTEALHRKATGGDTAHVLHPVVHGGRPGPGQLQVLLGAAGAIGMAADHDEPARLGLDVDQSIDKDPGRAGFELGAAGTE